MPLEPVTVLAVRALEVAFGPVRAVAGVDLTVPRRTVVGLVGPNGCGKTTTLRAVLGVVDRDAGAVTVQGFEAGSTAARALVAWVPDEPTGLDELTLAESLDLVAALWRADRGFPRRAVLLLEAFGLDARRRVPLGALSHGQRRLAAVVAAVALDRPLLVVDEATAALDPEAVIVLREVVRGVAAHGAGVLLATQDLHFAESLCDRVTLLSAGRVVAEGTVASLRSRYGARTLEEAFVSAVGVRARLEAVRDALDAL